MNANINVTPGPSGTPDGGDPVHLLRQDLQERNKELNCLYSISRLIRNFGRPVPGLLQRCLDLLPKAWAYPEIACARIIFQDQEYKTDNFKETHWIQKSDIVLRGEKKGSVEVAYLEERPQKDEGPFLKGERNLIDSVAFRLGMAIEFYMALDDLEIKDRALNSTLSAMAFADLSGNITYVNKTFLDLWGYDHAEEVIGRPLVQFSESEEKAEELIRALREKGEFRGPFAGRRKDGLRLDLYVSLRMVQDKEETHTCMMASFVDIGRRRALEEKLLRNERLAATGRLAVSVIHEIKSPLQAVAAILSQMKERYGSDEELGGNVDLLQETFDNIGYMVTNLLDVSRPGAEEKQTTSINQIITGTVDLLRAELTRKGVAVNLDLSPDIPEAMLSPQKMRQVFLNLIINAMEAMCTEGEDAAPPGSAVLIQTKSRGGNNVILVSDTGPGIPEENLPRIFEMFHTTKKASGSGIGLTTCRDIIEEHNGSIFAQNLPEGGAIFMILLPVPRLRAYRS